MKTIRRNRRIGEFLKELDLTEAVILQLAPMYVQRGTNIEIKPTNPDDPSEFSDLALDYFSLPVLVKLVTGNGMALITLAIFRSLLELVQTWARCSP